MGQASKRLGVVLDGRNVRPDATDQIELVVGLVVAPASRPRCSPNGTDHTDVEPISYRQHRCVTHRASPDPHTVTPRAARTTGDLDGLGIGTAGAGSTRSRSSMNAVVCDSTAR